MDFLNEINAKYVELEAEADRKLEKAKREEEKLLKLESNIAEQSFQTQQNQKVLSHEEARARNANLLKAIDMAKARLRSRSTFSPVEQILEKAIEDYKRDLLAAVPDDGDQHHIRSAEIHQYHDDENIYETL